MQFIVIILASTAALAGAQITLDPKTDKYTCPAGKQAFCAGDSLTTNIIVRCEGAVGVSGNCNDNLAGISPIGVKDFAPCYQTSPTAGDAACSYHGVVYPSNSNGYIFFLPSSPNATTNGTLPSASPISNISVTLNSLTAAPTSTQWVAEAISAALENKAPYPTVVNGSAAGTAGATGTGAVKPTSAPFKGGAGVLKVGSWVVNAGFLGAAVAVVL